MRIVRWRWRPDGQARTPRTSGQPWSAITELGDALADEKVGSLQLFEKLTGNEQLWWRCCREAAQAQPYWLLHDHHDKAFQVIRDTELVLSRGAVSRAAEAADLVCRALAAPDDPARPASALTEVVARAADCWDGSPAVLTAGGSAFTPGTAAASVAPRLRDRAREVLACLDSVSGDVRQAMVAICTLLLAADQPDAGRVASVPVVFARPGDRPAAPRGVAGTLELRELPPGPVGLFPDPRGMRNRRADPAFAAGLSLAWQFAAGASRGGRCVLWRLSLDGGVPDYAIDGGSLGAAFAVALRELLSRPRGSRPGFLAAPRALFVGLRPGCAITGVLSTQRPAAYDQPASRASDGPWLDEVGDMDAKLEAAGAKGLRLVAPAANRASAKPRATVPVDWAETIHQADRYARRIRPVRTAMTAIAILAVAGTSAGITTAVHYSGAASQDAASAAQQHALALSGQLAVQSEAFDTSDPVTAALLAAASWRIDQDNPAALESLLDAYAQPDHATLNPNDGAVNGVAYSRDGRVLATTNPDGKVRLWNASTHTQIGAPIIVPSDGNGGIVVDGVAFSPDGKILATADRDGTARLWDVSTRAQVGAPITIPGGNTYGGLFSVAFSPDGETLATGDGDGTVRLWDIATRAQIGAPITIPGGNSINGVAFSPDGKILATADGDKTARLWDVATRTQIGAPITLPSTSLIGNIIDGVAFSPDGKILATADSDGTARLWDLATSAQVGAPITVPGAGSDGGDVFGVAFSPDGETLATADGDGTARLWDLATSAQVGAPITVPGGNSIDGVAFSPDGKIVATADRDGAVRLWDVATRTQIGAPITVPGAGSVGGGVFGVAFSPDGETLATADQDGAVRLWDVATRAQIGAPIDFPSNGVIGNNIDGVALSPDGRTLATADGDGTVRLWDVATRTQIGAPITVSGGDGVNWVAFSPDGKTLATAGRDGTVRLLHVSTRTQIGAPIAVSGSSGQGVVGVAFSPNGELLATAGGDGTVQLWDVATRAQVGAPITVPGGGSGVLDGVAFSPDGKTLATAGGDGTARLWNVAFPANLVQAVCSIAGRSLTTGEWSTYVSSEPFQQVCPASL